VASLIGSKSGRLGPGMGICGASRRHRTRAGTSRVRLQSSPIPDGWRASISRWCAFAFRCCAFAYRRRAFAARRACTGLFHELPSVHPFREELIVGPAQQPQSFHRMRVRPGEALHVVEHNVRRLAPASLLVRIGAPTPIALPHCPLDRCGNVAGTGTPVSSGLRIGDSLPGLAPDAETLLLDLFDQEVHRLAEDRFQIAIGHPVAHQDFGFLYLVAECPAGDELNLEELGIQRRECRTKPTRLRSHLALCIRNHRRRCGRLRSGKIQRLPRGHGRRGCRPRVCRHLYDTALQHALGGRPSNLLRREPRHDLLDLPLRFPGGLRENRLVVRLGEVRCQQTQSREVHAPRTRRVEDGRQSPSRARDHDPVVRRGLGESQLCHAEGEHRRMRALEVELPLVDLTEMDEKLRLEHMRFPHQFPRRREQRVAAQRFHAYQPRHAIGHGGSVRDPSDKVVAQPRRGGCDAPRTAAALRAERRLRCAPNRYCAACQTLKSGSASPTKLSCLGRQSKSLRAFSLLIC
jgi:hypothetical protein